MNPNPEGTSRIVTSSTGVIEEDSDFYPFGGERAYIDTLANQKYKFTGKERDTESGLDYFGFRHYGSTMGRFVSPDSWPGDPANPQTLNRYAYALNNPLRFIDPTGHCAEPADSPDEQTSCGDEENIELEEDGRKTKIIPTYDEDEQTIGFTVQTTITEGDTVTRITTGITLSTDPKKAGEMTKDGAQVTVVEVKGERITEIQPPQVVIRGPLEAQKAVGEAAWREMQDKAMGTRFTEKMGRDPILIFIREVITFMKDMRDIGSMINKAQKIGK